MEYIQRTYRQHFRQDRWACFIVKYKESDLWIGINKNSWKREMIAFSEQFIRQLRQEMDTWISKNTKYAQALVPYPVSADAPGIFREMATVAEKSGIGPMSAVAGAVARKLGEALQDHFQVEEILIENGGDIYANTNRDIDIAVFAGTSPLSEKVGLHIEARYAPLGICTSSGTVGPSLSFGKADAVMIICQDVLLADTYATAFANTIQTADDITPCIEEISKHTDILSAIAIKGDKIGICGQFELKLF